MMFCPNCEKEISDGSIYCQFCGSKTQETQESSGKKAESNTPLSAGKTNNSMAATAAAIIFGAVLFIGGLVALLSRDALISGQFSQQEILMERMYGGSSISEAMTTIIILSSISMIIGLVLLVFSLVRTQRRV